MKKIISILTTALMCMGIRSFPVNAVYDYPTRETITLTSFEEVIDFFISEDAELSDGGVFYPDNYNIEFIERDTSCTIIVYGLQEVKDISKILSKAVTNGHHLSSYPEHHSGIDMGYSNDYYILKYNDIGRFSILFFVNNTLTDWLNNDISTLEASKHYSFDVIPYVYPNLTPGDADCDGLISADDASMVLSAYSMLSTGEDLILNSTIFDYNNDGLVNSEDASAILTKYSEFSTT